MKSKWSLIGAIVQLTVGVLAVLSFTVLWSGGEDMTRWIPTALLSLAFIVMGIIKIAEYRSDK